MYALNKWSLMSIRYRSFRARAGGCSCSLMQWQHADVPPDRCPRPPPHGSQDSKNRGRAPPGCLPQDMVGYRALNADWLDLGFGPVKSLRHILIAR